MGRSVEENDITPSRPSHKIGFAKTEGRIIIHRSNTGKQPTTMMIYTLALTALLTGKATAVSRSTKQEFIRSMRKIKTTLNPKILADAAKSNEFNKRIMDEAIQLPPGRNLEEEASAYQSNNNGDQNNVSYYSTNYVQGTDDAYSFERDVDWENLWGFDASQFSLSYERCATVKHFDVEKAAQEDATSPFRTQHFAVLRLCPTKTCDRPDWYLEVDEDGEPEEDASNVDDGEVYGANGRGCSSNYATFLLDAGKYLQLMAEFEESQLNMYCNYCEHYMQEMYELWLNHYPSYGYTFQDYSGKHHDAEWYSCSVYGKVCSVGIEDNYSDFLECTEVQKNNGIVAYTQATCSEDGESITLGLYSDESCSDDITSKVNMANWIGEDVEEDTMEHHYKRINSGLAELIETYGGSTSVDPESVCLPCGVEVSRCV